MPRPVSVPKLCRHKATGKAVVRLNGHDHYLGLHGTPEAEAAYNLLIAKWLGGGRKPLDAPPSAPNGPPRPSVNEVLLAYKQYAEAVYRDPDGKPTTEVRGIRLALRVVRELFGFEAAADFGPKKLARVREEMVKAGLARRTVNQRIERIKRAFRWAVAEELVPPAVYEALRALAGLREGRTSAPEGEAVQPIDSSTVQATTPFLNRHVRAMVELLGLTGMRPGECCRLSLGQMDRSGQHWLYTPVRHKTKHRGKGRVIPFGPRARAALVAFLVGDNPPPAGFERLDVASRSARIAAASAYESAGRKKDAELLRRLGKPFVLVAGCVVDPDATVFSPREARTERYLELRANRKSKVPPSQQNRKSKNPKKQLRESYGPEALANSITWACKRAGVAHWHPNQLRHSHATEVRRRYGLEAAQVVLGHSRADVTQIYAERNLALAEKVAGEMG